MTRTIRLSLLLLALSPAAAADAPAQADRDSLAALQTARREQARFEQQRRRNLPEVGRGDGGDCDERIGRFCLSHDDGADFEMPPEPRSILEARHRLLESLGEAAARIPGDRWVAGQRVRYLIDGRRYGEARDAAADCRAEPWWCAALTGYAAHVAGDAPAADSAYSAMLQAMPPEEREVWTDLADVLEPELRRWADRLPSSDRASFEATFWALADPFYGRGGNEVRSEHFTRILLDALQERAETPDNISWGGDLREILVRYGWPVGWSRIRQSAYAIGRSSFLAHYADSDDTLLPPPEVFLDEDGVAAGEWDMDREGARTGYAIPMADSVLVWWPPLDYQVALFHRRDSAVVVAAFVLPPDSIPSGVPVEASLAATSDGRTLDAVARDPDAGLGAVLSVRAPARPLLLSLEVVLEQARRATRVRIGRPSAARVPGRLAVSDLLVLHDDPVLPESLDSATRLARGSTRVRPGETVGVYWEVYGLEDRPEGELSMSLQVVKTDRGWLRRLAERAGVVRATQPIQLSWSEPWPPGAILGRALSLQIPPLPPGSYTIELSVSAPGEDDLVATQEIEVME